MLCLEPRILIWGFALLLRESVVVLESASVKDCL